MLLLNELLLELVFSDCRTRARCAMVSTVSERSLDWRGLVPTCSLSHVPFQQQQIGGVRREGEGEGGACLSLSLSTFVCVCEFFLSFAAGLCATIQSYKRGEKRRMKNPSPEGRAGASDCKQ